MCVKKRSTNLFIKIKYKLRETVVSRVVSMVFIVVTKKCNN